jgi:hypothetical protein
MCASPAASHVFGEVGPSKKEDAMNWMIDGAHGDLYRSAMGYALLKPAVDEWQAERQIGATVRRKRHRLAAHLRLLRRKLAAHYAKPHQLRNPVPTMEGLVL